MILRDETPDSLADRKRSARLTVQNELGRFVIPKQLATKTLMKDA